MKLQYSTFKDDDLFILTNFNCHLSQELLDQQGLYKIVWSRGKELNVTVDGYEMTIEQDQVIFCTPLNIIEIPLGEPDIISFVFNKEFFCIQTHDDQVSCNGFLFFGSAQPQIVKLCEKEKNHFTTLLSLFEEDFNVTDKLQGEMLRSLLKRMLIISTRMVKENLPEASISNSNMDIVRQYNILVERHFREKHQVQEYADLLFKSPKTLSNLFHKFGDKSPLMIIHERILLEAKRLLLYSDKTTEEITLDLGYSDSSHFSKFFKKHEGLSPNMFRKQKNEASNG